MSPHTHDHQLNIAGTAYEFDLVRDDQDASMYTITEDVPQYQANLRFTQQNWVNGHGQYKLKDSSMFLEGQSIDTFQDGKLFLGAAITTVQLSGGALDSAPVGFFWGETAGKWFCFTAGKIYLYDGTNWVAATTTLTRVRQIVEFGGYLWAARGQATAGTWAAGDEYYTSPATDNST